MQFLNPALLAGALLFAVPLLIHLLNRQRHKRRPWAAMDFLLRAYKKQRSRMRNENLLLLLLRCLVPIVLALAIARPVLESAAGVLGSRGAVHHVVVLDGSYSMGVQDGGQQSPFERSRQLVARLFDSLEQDPAKGGKVTMVFAGVRPRFLVRGDLNLQTARSQWLLLQRPDDAAGEIGEAIFQVADLLDEAPGEAAQVYVFTDLQARSFGKALASPEQPAEAELYDTARDAVERLQKREDTQLHWIDCGPLAERRSGGTVDNVQLTELVLGQPIAIARTPTELVARLRNRGQQKAEVEVTLDIDGSEPMRKLVSLAPGAEGEAEFQVSFRELGRRKVRASLTGDALTADDERFLAVEVRDRVRVLLVDGAADDDPLRTYRYVFEALLDPDPTALPTFAVQACDALALLSGRVEPGNFDVVVLADLDRLNHQAAERLRSALAADKGLLVMGGERTDVESLNLHLFAAGAGPLPIRLGEPLGGTAGSSVLRTATMLRPEHPVFAEFEEEIYREIFAAIPVQRWLGSSKDSLREGATVLATLTDAEQSPLLVVADHQEGRVALWTSALASEYRPTRWNKFDDPMVAFPLLHGLIKWLALPANDPFHVLVGAELTCAVAGRPLDLAVQRPERDGGSRLPVGGEPRALPGGRFVLPALRDTEQAGFYTYEMQLDRDDGRQPFAATFAVNVVADEGELRYASHDEAKTALALPRVLTGLPATAEAAQEQGGNELGPSLLLALLLFVLGEAALARYVSIRRN